MSNLRAASAFWTDAAVNGGDVSPGVSVGDAPYVAIYVSNTGALSTDITVQVTASSDPFAGINQDMSGSTWFDYQGLGTITCANGKSICFDISPFAPPYIRLKSSASTTLTAFVTSNG